MDAVKAIYQSVGLDNPQTFLQSGNIVYRTCERDLERIGLKIEAAIEQSHGFRPAVIQRTLAEFRRSVAANPFPLELLETLDPAKLLVTFLAAEPHPGAGPKLRAAHPGPEHIHLIGRELFIYFPNGIGKSQIPPTLIDKTLRITGTGRNWNTVTKLLELAESAAAE
jgi:uncharacterized protein (DUF1697 family)